MARKRRKNPWPKGKSRKRSNAAKKAWATRRRKYGKNGRKGRAKPAKKKVNGRTKRSRAAKKAWATRRRKYGKKGRPRRKLARKTRRKGRRKARKGRRRRRARKA